ncbi:hypothetical protein GSI_14407 [Ganoderma sinense ZZ0214-1]|uniref:Uncharacterized protein n=1 Tax=Ganoderma sinense ZZ0214-1 TaxID=1077348 RepID=A0A2G8RNL1_9APHY|nr:hypothetical protein GSI_14407 [Ganoderma sinense ZZ0214-1]
MPVSQRRAVVPLPQNLVREPARSLRLRLRLALTLPLRRGRDPREVSPGLLARHRGEVPPVLLALRLRVGLRLRLLLRRVRVILARVHRGAHSSVDERVRARARPAPHCPRGHRHPRRERCVGRHDVPHVLVHAHPRLGLGYWGHRRRQPGRGLREEGEGRHAWGDRGQTVWSHHWHTHDKGMMMQRAHRVPVHVRGGVWRRERVRRRDREPRYWRWRRKGDRSGVGGMMVLLLRRRVRSRRR